MKIQFRLLPRHANRQRLGQNYRLSEVIVVDNCSTGIHEPAPMTVAGSDRSHGDAGFRSKQGLSWLAKRRQLLLARGLDQLHTTSIIARCDCYVGCSSEAGL